MDKKQMTKAVKQKVISLGADIVGIGNVERFKSAPRGHGPTDIVPGAKSVISFGIRLLDPVVESTDMFSNSEEWGPLPDIRVLHNERFIYEATGDGLVLHELSFIANRIGVWLETAYGYRSMGFFPDYIPIMHGYPIPPDSTKQNFFGQGNVTWYGPFSQRHAAVLCGLGEFGYNNLVLTKNWGPRVKFNSIITEAELVPDPLVSEPICLRDECNLCIKACPTYAFRLKGDVDKKKVFIETPCEHTSVINCLQRLNLPRQETCYYGDCMRICPLGKPKYLSARLKKFKKGPI